MSHDPPGYSPPSATGGVTHLDQQEWPSRAIEPVSDPPRTLRGMRGRNTTQDHLYTDAENAAADEAWAALDADALRFARSVGELADAGLIDLSPQARDDLAFMRAADQVAHPYTDDPYPLG